MKVRMELTDLIETSLLFLCEILLISMKTASLTYEKQVAFYKNKVKTPAVTIFKGQETKHTEKIL